MNILFDSIPSTRNKSLTNKIDSATSIIKMQGALVPRKKGMEVIRHWAQKSYDKYYNKVVENCALQNIQVDKCNNGKHILYSHAIMNKNEWFENLKVIFILL